jgi:hypothetical protein
MPTAFDEAKQRFRGTLLWLWLQPVGAAERKGKKTTLQTSPSSAIHFLL